MIQTRWHRYNGRSILLAPASKGGMPCVERAAKANLSAHFLLPATSFVAENLRLEMP